jgi:hypothetical protein
MRPLSKVKVHGHHTISFETLQKIEWHLANLPDVGWTTIKEMKSKEHRKLHAKRRSKNKDWGSPVYFGQAILGYRKVKAKC